MLTIYLFLTEVCHFILKGTLALLMDMLDWRFNASQV